MKIEIKNKVSLESLNTFGIDCMTSKFVVVRQFEDLLAVIRSAELKEVPKFILGGGSNILLLSNYEGLTINNDLKGIRKIHEDEEHVWVESMGGEEWVDLVDYCVARNWGGIENLTLIPGSVGAAPMQNIGAYGVELCDVFDSLLAIDLESGGFRIFDKDDCEFAYRQSIFKNKLKDKYFIASVVIRLSKKPKLNMSYGAIGKKFEEEQLEKTVANLSKVVADIRRSKLPDPKVIGNSGSFFKNVVVPRAKLEEIETNYENVPSYAVDDPSMVKIPSGWLIEKCGWKGKRVGNTGTYKNQALVLVNHGGATGEEVLKLSDEIMRSVKERFGIELDREVNVIA